MTISIPNYPQGDSLKERTRELAESCKHAIFGSGSPPLPDETLLRAALALDAIMRGGSRSGEVLPELAVLYIATAFLPERDAERHEQVREALGQELCGPVAELCRAVETNRRLVEPSEREESNR